MNIDESGAQWYEYEIVTARTPEELTQMVNEKLQEAFSPVGGPFVFDGLIHQAMWNGDLSVYHT